MTNNQDNVIKLYHDNLLNLAEALEEAGGSVSIFKKDMALESFLLTCARNSVNISAIVKKENINER